MSRAVRHPVTGVTPQQDVFACEFAKTGRATLAYKRAYPDSTMDDRSCASEANKLLHDQRVVARVEHFQRIAARKLEASVEQLAMQAARIAFLDIRDLYDEQGRLLKPQDLPTDVALALDSLEVVEMEGGAVVAVDAPGGDGGGKRKKKRKPDAMVQADENGLALVHVPMYTKKVRFGRTKALEMLMQWRKMLRDDSQTRLPGDLASMTEEEFEKAYAETKAAVDMIERARQRGTLVHRPKGLPHKQA